METLKNIIEIIEAIAALATIGGLFVVILQLKQVNNQIRLSERIAQSQLESGLSQEYREIIRQIPYGLLLGTQIFDQQKDKELLNQFYGYFDLCNEQIYLRMIKKDDKNSHISDRTWSEWVDGIQKNFDKKAFKDTWKIIKEDIAKSKTLQELLRLIDEEFKQDPKYW